MAIEYANSDPIKVTHTKGSANGGIKYTNTLPWKVELTNDDLAYQEDITNLQRQINALEADLTWRDPVTNYEDLPTTGNDDGDVRLVTSTGVLYVWAGSEWVALNENNGGATKLTEADYDYPADNPTSIHLMNLAPGMYQIDSETYIRYHLGTTTESTRYATFIVGNQSSYYPNNKWVALVDSSGVRIAYSSSIVLHHILDSRKIVNNLTTTSAGSVLDAYQGKVLKDMIDNLPTGGITELTAADYATGKQYIEAWTLPVGLYRVDNHGKLPSRSTFVHWRPYIGNTSVEQGCNVFLVADHSQNSAAKTIVCFYTTGGDSLGEFKISVYSVNSNDGNLSQQYRLISSGEVKDSLTETTTNMPLSANQGRILKNMIGDLASLSTTDKTNLVAAINELVASNSGVTIFYFRSGIIGHGYDIEGPIFYKDVSYQIPATWADIYAAFENGKVLICSNMSDDLFYSEVVSGYDQQGNYSITLTNFDDQIGSDCKIWGYNDGTSDWYNFDYAGIVQTTGTSTTDVMSQNATTSMVYADPATKTQIQLGNSTSNNLNTVSIGNNIAAEGTRAIAIGDRTDDSIVTASGASAISIGVNNSSIGGNGIAIGVRAKAIGDGSIAWGTYATSSGQYALATHYQSEASGKFSSAIGPYAKALKNSAMAFGAYAEANGLRGVAVGEHATTDANGTNNMAVGYYASATGDGSMAVGLRASSTAPHALALGSYASATQQGEMNIGATNNNYGYNNSNYRLLSGVYDPQSAHDAATKGYVDGLVGNIEAALNVINNGESS